MTITKTELHNRFTRSIKALGVYFGDADTGLKKKDFVAAGNDRDNFCELALLPDGGDLGICTCGADYVIKTLGHGARYGFDTDNNPSVKDSEILQAGGHDFALIAGRFIVDPWYAFSESKAQGVYDITSAKDRPAIMRIYGNPDCWSYYDQISKTSIEMTSDKLPEEFLVKYPVVRGYEDQGPTF